MSAKTLQAIVAVSWVLFSGGSGAAGNPVDPVRVVDKHSKPLMTERDVIALANIHHFAVTTSAPHHHDLSRQQIYDVASLVNRHIAKTGSMPKFYGEAAEYWADLQRRWPNLSTEQQYRTREYARSMLRVRASSQESARASRQASQSAHRHSTHDHESCDCEYRSSRNHSHTHNHNHHSHNDSGHQQHRSSGQRSRYDPAAVTAEVGNFPIMSDAIFPP